MRHYERRISKKSEATFYSAMLLNDSTKEAYTVTDVVVGLRTERGLVQMLNGQRAPDKVLGVTIIEKGYYDFYFNSMSDYMKLAQKKRIGD